MRYRVQQFFRAITVRVKQGDIEAALTVLPPGAQARFLAQSRQDQGHALAVFSTLKDAGHHNQDLLAAALLHDVGKAAAAIPAWQRAIIVLLEHYSSRTLSALSQGEAKGLRRPFVIHARHSESGAAWAEEAGCSPITVALIRRHHEPAASAASTEQDELLKILQAADSIN